MADSEGIDAGSFYVWNDRLGTCRRFSTFYAAERFAKRKVRDSDKDAWNVVTIYRGYDLVARINRDALDRVWTDLADFEGGHARTLAV